LRPCGPPGPRDQRLGASRAKLGPWLVPGSVFKRADEGVYNTALVFSPEGELWVGKTDDGIRVVEVWESKEQFQRFAEEQIGPYTRKAGFPGSPRSASTKCTTT
jgi:predicted amidohydrolase